MTETPKATARKAAADRRKAAHETVDPAPALAALAQVLAPHAGQVIAGYLPIGSEIDPRPVMAEMVPNGPVCVPVVTGKGRALAFHRWTPDAPLTKGAFGVEVPVDGALMVPEVVIVPMLAYDRAGFRLGYGGGFYDRSLAALRANGACLAIGFAYAAQLAETLPLDPFDQVLDMVVTEDGVLA